MNISIKKMFYLTCIDWVQSVGSHAKLHVKSLGGLHPAAISEAVAGQNSKRNLERVRSPLVEGLMNECVDSP